MVLLIEAIEEQSGQRPEEILTDSGYCSEENLKYLAKMMAGFVATEKQKHGERNEPCNRGPLTERRQSRGAHEAKAEDQGGSGRLRETKMYG